MTIAQMAVFHLSTGHVVAAMTAVGRLPTVADATGGTHIVIRIPAGPVVRVPAELLTALPVPPDEDVLTRPTHFRLVDAVPTLSLVGPPVLLKDVKPKAGIEAVSIWDGGPQVEVVRDPLDADGKTVGQTPPGATHRLVAVKGEPLMYEP